jgi:hypothetical protein
MSIYNEKNITSYDTPVITFNNYTTVEAAGGSASPTGSWYQNATYTWTSGATRNTTISQSNTFNTEVASYTYSIKDGSATSGLTLNTSNGTVTWENNKSESKKSEDIKISITYNGKTGTATATTEQYAGSKSYGDITINSFTYGNVVSSGGSSSPSISYSQPWGWNGNTTDGGTITGTEPNDTNNYITYSGSATGLTLNTTTGVVTWNLYNPTSGVQDTAGR